MRGRTRVLTTALLLLAGSGAAQTHNTFEQPTAVQPVEFKGTRLSGGTLNLELPSRSVVVLELR